MATLRQRRTGTLIDEEMHVSQPLLRRVAQVDMFPKPREEYRRTQTQEGALISLVAAVLIGMLVLWEIGAYAVGRDAYRSELSVDSGLSLTVPFNFDITFPSLPCHELSIDAMDAAGGLETNVAHDLFKSPVDRHGNLVFQGRYNYVEKRLGPDGKPLPQSNYDEKSDPKSPNFCGKCYIEPRRHHLYDKPGGLVDAHITSVHKDACCNTCESVMKMYDLHRLPRPHANEVEQCMMELSHANPGCNIKGTLDLKKVMGNFHIAPGVSAYGPMGQHIHQYDYEQLLRFNSSHIINKFSIGDKRVERFSKHGVKQPLEGFQYVVHGGHGHIKYYLQVVPTTYVSGSRARTSDSASFEYSVQLFHKEFAGGFGMLPSVFFVFDFHPIQVNHRFERPAFTHFLVQLCGIVGGLFVVMGLVDRFVAYAKSTS